MVFLSSRRGRLTGMPKTSKHRRSRSNPLILLALFVALLLGWLGWNVRLVQQRKQMLVALEASTCLSRRGFREYAGESEAVAGPTTPPEVAAKIDAEVAATVRGSANAMGDKWFVHYTPSAPLAVSKLREWLGDTPILSFVYRPGPDPDEVRRLFPEAALFVLKPGVENPFAHRPLPPGIPIQDDAPNS